MSDDRSGQSSEDRIVAAYPLVAIEARRPKSLPRGCSTEDLESCGGEALIEASANWSPDRGPWLRFAKFWVRNAIRDQLKAARRRAGRTVPLEIETDDGEFLPRPDPKSPDPQQQASERERVENGRNTLNLAAARLKALPPSKVAAKAMALQEEVFEALPAGSMGRVIKAILAKADGGDVRAARLLLDVIQSGATVVSPPADAGDL